MVVFSVSSFDFFFFSFGTTGNKQFSKVALALYIYQYTLLKREVMAQWLESRTRNPKVGIVGGGSESPAISLHPQYHD